MLISINRCLTIAYVKKLIIINVEEGPILLNLDVPNEGSIKFKLMDGIKVRNMPKKQYFICMRFKPIEFLKDFTRYSIPIKKNARK